MDPKLFDALDKFHTFYSDAFSSLVTVTFGLVAFVGVVFPLIISIIQNRQLKRENESLKLSLEQKAKELVDSAFVAIEQKNSDARKGLESHIDAKLGELKARIDVTTAESMGSIFHLQANASYGDGEYVSSTRSYCVAVSSYLKSSNLGDMRLVAMAIYDHCMPRLTKDDFDEDAGLEKKVATTIEAIKKRNENGAFSDLIKNMEKALLSAKKRPAEAPKVA